jgi:hypothetical protein
MLLRFEQFWNVYVPVEVRDSGNFEVTISCSTIISSVSVLSGPRMKFPDPEFSNNCPETLSYI